jgi:hypothetical protein
MLAELNTFFDDSNNYQNYREALARAVQSGVCCIPYIGLVLKDLTFIEDGSPSFFFDGSVNIEKFRVIASIYSTIERARSEKLPFERDSRYQEWLRNGFTFLAEDKIQSWIEQIE